LPVFSPRPLQPCRRKKKKKKKQIATAGRVIFVSLVRLLIRDLECLACLPEFSLLAQKATAQQKRQRFKAPKAHTPGDQEGNPSRIAQAGWACRRKSGRNQIGGAPTPAAAMLDDFAYRPAVIAMECSGPVIQSPPLTRSSQEVRVQLFRVLRQKNGPCRWRLAVPAEYTDGCAKKGRKSSGTPFRVSQQSPPRRLPAATMQADKAR